MNLSYRYFVTVLVGALICLESTSQAVNEGAGKVKLGYTFVDEEGNLGVNQQTYNLYEGSVLSLEDWSYFFDNGVTASANLSNVTLNNRNLRATVRKPGLFALSAYNNQYRRTYEFDGAKFTRRRSSGGSASVQPHKNVRLFGGYNATNKHGDNFEALSPVRDTVLFNSDYAHTSLNVGGQVGNRYRFVRAEFRRFSFDDKANLDSDREADKVYVTAATTVPRYDWIVLSGGYHHRLDKIGAKSVELKTNQGWGATKIYLPQNFIFDYRILFARTRHTGTLLETDNVINTAALGKNWPGRGGLRVGYENRIADDLVDRTESDGFLLRAWYNCRKRLFANLLLSTRSKDVVTGATLVGDEDYTRYRLSLRYVDDRWGAVSGRWQGRVRKNDDINSKVNYDALTSELTLRQDKYGKLVATYSYYLGQYENRSDNVSFEFADHVISGTVYPPAYGSLSGEFGGSYYRSRRDVDVEKFSLHFGVVYTFLEDHHLEAKYNVYNYDDLLTRRSYYTANIVEVNLIKDLKL